MMHGHTNFKMKNVARIEKSFIDACIKKVFDIRCISFYVTQKT